MHRIHFIRNFLLMATVVAATACTKYKGDYDATGRQEIFSGTTYDYLKSKPGVFDSMLYIIDRLGLADTLKTKTTTLFAVTNQSFTLALSNYNAPRLLLGQPPVSLATYAPDIMDSMICRYLIPKAYPSDSMLLGNGLTVAAVRYNYPMNAKKITTDASGYVNGGPANISFSDTKRSSFSGNWAKGVVSSIDIRTASGIVHIMDPSHVFGFDEFTKPRPLPFKGTPFPFPATIGGTGILLEAEDFDLGGETAAYHDNDPANSGNNYRLKEGVDIYAHPAVTIAGTAYIAGFDIGATNVGEWLYYTVNVPATGSYNINVRYAAPAGSLGAYHIEIDGTNVTGRISAPPTSTATNNYNTWAIIPHTLPLTAGKHSMKFYFEGAIQLESYVIIRNN